MHASRGAAADEPQAHPGAQRHCGRYWPADHPCDGAGERDPHTLAAYRDAHCRKSEAEIAAALTGHYKAEHVFALRQALAGYDFFCAQIQACDVEIAQIYQTVTPASTRTAPPLAPRPRVRSKRRHEPAFDLRSELYHLAGVDLTDVTGLDVVTVQAVLTETGVDPSRWPSGKHFTAWLGLSPENAKTGGKTLAPAQTAGAVQVSSSAASKRAPTGRRRPYA